MSRPWRCSCGRPRQHREGVLLADALEGRDGPKHPCLLAFRSPGGGPVLRRSSAHPRRESNQASRTASAVSLTFRSGSRLVRSSERQRQNRTSPIDLLATSRRKIDVFGPLVNGTQQCKTRRDERRGLKQLMAGCEVYGAARRLITRPMLTRLSEITPSPTQRCIPISVLYRQRLSPCRRLTTLMRPSHPVRHFWPLRNQRFFCSRLRSGLLLERLGTHTRLTPIAFAAASFLPE